VRRVAIRRIALALVVALTAQGTATSVLERSVAEIFGRADAAVFGEVTSVDSELVDDRIRTRVEIAVARVFSPPGDALPGDQNADARADEIGTADEVRVLTFLAGQLPSGSTTVVDDVPLPSRGDRVLVAWYQGDDLVSPIVGVWQGLWHLSEDGLIDARGRVLGVDDDLVTLGGAERDVATVLNALETALDESGDVRLDDRLGTDDPDAPRDALPDAPSAPEGGDEGAAEGADEDADEDGRAGEAAPPGPAGPPTPIELRVDVPDDEALRSALDDATRAWTDVGVPLRLVIDDEASDRVRIGSLAAFGSDGLAYSRRVADRDGVELLLRPGPDGRRVDVLARELGRWLGLPDDGPLGRERDVAADGVRTGLFPADALLLPDPQDAAALLRVRSGRPEDLDGDGVVDLYDLALLAEAYGSVGTRLRADLDGSGRVDDADVDRLEEAYEFLPASRDAPGERRSTDPGSAQN